MMRFTTEQRIQAFVALGEFMASLIPDQEGRSDRVFPREWRSWCEEAIQLAKMNNPWFTEENLSVAIRNISSMLLDEEMEEWIAGYRPGILRDHHPRRIGVVMAGNIPMAGFHDMLCVFMSGHDLLARMSSDDQYLLPVFTEILCRIEPMFAGHFLFTTAKMGAVDAVIATGSNNTFRYFEYYFRDKPRILRKNRNGVAVIRGEETEEELRSLADDIFLYFGLGCRNVSCIFVPEGYDPAGLFPAFLKYADIIDHHKYRNNYDYYKSIMLINRERHLDNGYVLLRPAHDQYASPVSVVHYMEYHDAEDLNLIFRRDAAQLQCIVTNDSRIDGGIPFGTSQSPRLSDYADGVDTLEFLLNIK